MKKLSPLAAIATLFLVLFLCPAFAHAAGTLTASQTTASFGVNDQTDTTSATRANNAGTDASLTLTVNGIPTASTTSTIGSCVVTYSTTVSGTTNCNGNAVILNVATNNTLGLIATALHALTNISDNVNGHGALTSSQNVDQVTFSTSGTEASSSLIHFVDGTGGTIFASATTTGVAAVSQVNTVTVGGTVETGDQFHVEVPTGQISYTTQSSDTSLTNIANGLGAAIVASSTYSSQPFTIATSSNTVVFTAKTAGTGFSQTSSTTNATAVAQVVTFTPSNTSGPEVYTVTLNGTAYPYNDGSGLTSNIVGGIVYTLAGNPTASCVNTNSSTVTCTASNAGTPFTFSASTSSSGSSSNTSGVGGGGGSSYTIPANHTTSTSGTTTTTTSANTGTTLTSYPTGTAEKVTKTLNLGATGASVTALQTLLAADSTLGFTVAPTGYFGHMTLSAVEAFQVKYEIVSPGQSGYGTVGPKTRAMLVKIFG